MNASEGIAENSTSESEDRAPQQNLDKVMEDLGFGRFQILAYAAIGFGINSVGFWFYILGYLYQEPGLRCKIADPHDPDYHIICTRTNICAGDSRILSWEVDENHELTLHNWR